MPRKRKTEGVENGTGTATAEMGDVAAMSTETRKRSDLFYAVIRIGTVEHPATVVQIHKNIWRARKAIPHLQDAVLALGGTVTFATWKCRLVAETELD